MEEGGEVLQCKSLPRRIRNGRLPRGRSLFEDGRRVEERDNHLVLRSHHVSRGARSRDPGEKNPSEHNLFYKIG